jgi:hypothetical protein
MAKEFLPSAILWAFIMFMKSVSMAVCADTANGNPERLTSRLNATTNIPKSLTFLNNVFIIDSY